MMYLNFYLQKFIGLCIHLPASYAHVRDWWMACMSYIVILLLANTPQCWCMKAYMQNSTWMFDVAYTFYAHLYHTISFKISQAIWIAKYPHGHIAINQWTKLIYLCYQFLLLVWPGQQNGASTQNTSNHKVLSSILDNYLLSIHLKMLHIK